MIPLLSLFSSTSAMSSSLPFIRPAVFGEISPPSHQSTPSVYCLRFLYTHLDVYRPCPRCSRHSPSFALHRGPLCPRPSETPSAVLSFGHLYTGNSTSIYLFYPTNMRLGKKHKFCLCYVNLDGDYIGNILYSGGWAWYVKLGDNRRVQNGEQADVCGHANSASGYALTAHRKK